MNRHTRPFSALITASLLATILTFSPGSASASGGIPEVEVRAGWTSHIQNIGTRTVSDRIELVDGANVMNFTLGTQGQSLRLEYVRADSVVIDSEIENVLRSKTCSIQIQGHVQNVGWQAISSSAGTIGRSLRLEAIRMWSGCSEIKIRYSVHVQNIGWMDTKTAGQTAGTTGRGLAIEAIRVSLEAPNLHYVGDAIRDADCRAAGTC